MVSILLRTKSFVVCSLRESVPFFSSLDEKRKKQGGKNGVLTNLIIMGLFFEVFYFRQFWVQKCIMVNLMIHNNTRRVCTPTTPSTVRKRERTHESVPTRRRRATGVCFKYCTTTTTKTTTRTTKEQRRHRRTGPPGALTRFFTTTATRTIITKRSSTEIIYVSACSRRRRRSLCVYSSVAATNRMPLPWSL